MINKKSKKAFSMVTAIFVMVFMASLTAMIMSVTGKTLKATTNQYQKEQAQILTRSYTELALLYALNYDRSLVGNSCLKTINATFGEPQNLYTIRVELRYIANRALFPNGCTRNISPAWNIPAPMLNIDQSMSVIIDTYISYKDFDDPSASVANGDRNITFHRRTLQKL